MRSSYTSAFRFYNFSTLLKVLTFHVPILKSFFFDRFQQSSPNPEISNGRLVNLRTFLLQEKPVLGFHTEAIQGKSNKVYVPFPF